MLNYGYVPNTIRGDSEELDAYLIGEFEPVTSSIGKVIALHKMEAWLRKLIETLRILHQNSLSLS